MIGLFLIGCTPEHGFLRRDGADLPFWVEGEDTGTLVVVQHGSGAAGALYDRLPAFDRIEQAARVAYWDQRGAGNSQGTTASDSLGLEASVADLRLLLDVLDERERPERVVLLGHSLGGGISLAALLDGVAVDGLVDVSGGRSLPESFRDVAELQRTWAEANGDDEMLAFYEGRVDFPRQEPERGQHTAFVERVLLDEGFDQDASTAGMTRFLVGRGLRTTWQGFDPFGLLLNTSRVVQDFPLQDVDMAPEDVEGLGVRSLVVSGSFDRAVPPSVSQRTYGALAGSAPATFVQLEEAGHFPFWDAPEPFADAVVGFLADLP